MTRKHGDKYCLFLLHKIILSYVFCAFVATEYWRNKKFYVMYV